MSFHIFKCLSKLQEIMYSWLFWLKYYTSTILASCAVLISEKFSANYIIENMVLFLVKNFIKRFIILLMFDIY